MLYGVTFGDYNTLTDWGLYTVRQAMLSAPEPKTHTVDIPGGDSSVDLTESLIGYAAYYDRELSFLFKGIAPREDWDTIYSAVLNAIHGETMQIILDEDPNYYYTGRVQVGALTPINNRAFTIDVMATVNPFKWEVDEASYSQTFSSSDISASTRVKVTSGRNVSGQSWNVDYRYGTAEIPTFDWSVYQSIYIEFTPASSQTMHFIQFVDGSGSVYNESYNTSDFSYLITISKLKSEGIDPSTLYRILISGSSAATVYVDTYNAVVMTVEGAKRTTAPVIYVLSAISSVSLNGASYGLTAGNNQIADLQLQEGGNDLIFYGTFTSTTIEVSFRRGWL